MKFTGLLVGLISSINSLWQNIPSKYKYININLVKDLFWIISCKNGNGMIILINLKFPFNIINNYIFRINLNFIYHCKLLF